MLKKTILGTGMAVAAAMLFLAGCSGDQNNMSGMNMSGGAAPSPATAGTHNDADMTFARDMVQHHQQALDMARLAASRASNAQVKDLASRIEKAQDPEI